MRSVSRGVCLAVAAVMVAGGRADAETAKEVIQKAIEAHGGADNLKKYPAARMTSKGKLSIMGLEIDVEGKSVYMLPDKAKNVLEMEVANQKIKVTQIVNGGKFKVTANDMTPPLSDAQKDELRDSVALQAMQNLVPLLDERAYEISLIDKPEKVKDKEVLGVLVKAKNIKDVKLFFDKKSNLLVKLERRGLDPMEKEVVQEMIFLDHKKFDGIMRMTRTEVFLDGKKFMEAEVTDYKHLDKVDPKEFDISD